MDIDDLLNFINEDDKGKKNTPKKAKQIDDKEDKDKDNTQSSKKKRKRKKNNAQKEMEKEIEQDDQLSQPQESIIHSNNIIKENKYKSQLNYQGIEITNSRQQDNTTLRLIGNWKEKENWTQT